MHITIDDLNFLISLENRLGKAENWSDDVMRLWELNDKLLRQREASNEKTRVAVATRRATDKNYARSKVR